MTHKLIKNFKDIIKNKQFNYNCDTWNLEAPYIAYGYAKEKQSLSNGRIPYIEILSDEKNLEIQQKFQKYLCVQELNKLIKDNQEIRFINDEYNIEGGAKVLGNAVNNFILNAIKHFVNKGENINLECEYLDIYFYNIDNYEVHLPVKLIKNIWRHIELEAEEQIKQNEKGIDSELKEQEARISDYYSNLV